MDTNNDRFKRHHHHSRSKSFAFGVLVILAGVLLLGRNSGMIDDAAGRVIFSWEMLIIAIGVLNIFNRHSIVAGLILISVGAFFLLVNHFNLPFTLWHVFWPVLIIFIGLSLIFGASRFRKRHYYKYENTANNVSAENAAAYAANNMEYSDDFFEDIAIFGGGERRIMSQQFRGGKIVAVFGGSKVDLSHANLAPGVNVIEVFASFGGTSLLVPSDWNVKVEVFNIFGGYADKRMITQVNFEKTLIIKGFTLFGGGEIRSF